MIHHVSIPAREPRRGEGERHLGETLDFDPDALREKYRYERDRRLRPDGNDQYLEIAADFRHYIEDPHVERAFRKPLSGAVVVIVGGGFGGLLAAARLRESGVKDIRIIEKGGDFGGTWYWNRYPGAQCDIDAAAGRDWPHSQGKIQFRRRDPCACASDWRAVRSLSTRRRTASGCTTGSWCSGLQSAA